MKTYLITGSNGLLGQKLVYALLSNKTVTLIATGKGPNRLNEQKGYAYFDIDFSNEKEIKKLIDQTQPDVVINCAAVTNVDACEKDKEACWKINVLAVKSMIEELRAMKFAGKDSHFIQISTDFVFDGKDGPYKETDDTNPLSYYAKSKLAAEQLVSESGLKGSIARTIIIYGVTDGNQRSNIVLWVKNALTNGQSINVITDQYRAPTLAEDLAQGCIAIAEKGATGIYHLSGPTTYSIWTIAQMTADFWKLNNSLMKPVTSIALNQPAKRPPVTGFILDKAKKDLNYNPRDFIEGLREVDAQLKRVKV